MFGLTSPAILPAFCLGRGLALSLELPRFYASDADLKRICCQLHLTFCPFCRRIGTLILHGWLYGYADDSTGKKIQRGKRLICSTRRTRNCGCGRTVSLWLVDTLRRSRLGARKCWRFLKNVLRLGDKLNALRQVNADFSDSSAYRVWKRFVLRQSAIRTALNSLCPPPQQPATREPAAQTIAHLRAAFPNAACPILAFQQQLQIPFL